MGLVAERSATREKKQMTLPKKGPRPAILTGLIDVGVHVRTYLGQKKKPAREFIPVFTLVSDFYEDEEGVHRNCVTRPWPIKLLPGTERGHYADFVSALDPESEVLNNGQGDLTKLIGRGCFVNMVHSDPDDEGFVYANARGVTAIPEDYPLPALEFDPLIFDCDNPDPEVFEKLGSYTQDHVRTQEGFAGSKLEAILDGKAPAPKKEAAQAQDPDQEEGDGQDDDSPF